MPMLDPMITTDETVRSAERQLAAAYLAALRDAVLTEDLDPEDQDDPGLQALAAFVKVHAVYPRRRPRLIVIGLNTTV